VPPGRELPGGTASRLPVTRAAVARPITLLLVAVLAMAGCADDEQPRTKADRSSSPITSAPASDTSSPTGSATTETSSLGELSQTDLDQRLRDAAWANQVPRARRLIDAGADVNAKDDTEQSAYLISTSEGHLRLLGLTLRHGADITSLDSYDGTGLIRAADRGHTNIVGRLLREGIDVDHVNNLGWTALHEAIILGDGSRRYVDTVRTLVAGRADLRIAPRQDGIAPVQHARLRGYDEIATTLRRALRADRPDDPDTALLRAARRGDPDRVAIALRHGADIEARDGNRRTPLLLAATYDRTAAARLLVAMGASPDALDDRHDTPFLVTGVTGSVAMLETMLPARPDFTIVNRFGGTALIPAADRGHLPYVRRAVDTGIDINHVNDLGWTALLEAVILGDGSRDYQRIVQVLLEHGADPSIPDSDGVSARDHAANRGFTEIARLLATADA
jgi:hypothetical protein